MKDKDKLLTCITVATAAFVSPWAVVCAAGSYFTWKHLEKQKENQKQDAETDSSPAEDPTEKEDATMGFDTSEKEEFISQKDIDSLLNSEQAEDEIDPFDPEKNTFK